MRLPWISKREHDKQISLKNHIINGYIYKCNNLEKDIVKKEDTITNHIDSDMEHALENQCLRTRVKSLERMIERYENNACELNKERIAYEKLFIEYKELYKRAINAAQIIINERIKLEQELTKTKGELDKLKNTYRMLEGDDGTCNVNTENTMKENT